MKAFDMPVFSNYEEEAAFWDKLDTADLMIDDDEWFHFDTPNKRAVRVAILPQIAERLMHVAHKQGVSMETLVNVLLSEQLHEPVVAE